ncbi:acyl-CoA dehydrogenase family protein [Candidatus Obscuribacterales bacterium]|jgi:acyl-CoA dehydrogenase|nr:acyl-CoA dehydrogenase family protein [Candidatus Obscuribacterales bacterium]MBX3134981.1 acyl-CoA dehydrogenase family protein [Candidatus Obscuribacterales bacterium]MBX3151761.1 acyl-CoA dehydrogenase family protein [Candidatus Obscuribacterales bacterium]
MPHLKLTEEREQFRQVARDFTEGEIKPKAAEYDSSGKFPADIFEEAWKTGLVNFQIPERMGGLELDALSSCLILEELAAGCSGIGGVIEASTIAQLPVVMFGNRDLKETYLQSLLDKPQVAGYASYDTTSDDLVLRIRGEDYVLEGHHDLVVNGGEAAWYLVNVKDPQKGNRTVFIVPADAEGLKFEDKAFALGRKARVARKATFSNVRLTSDHIVGNEGQGDLIRTKTWPHICCFIAAGATGVARSAMQHAIAYSKERKTFGRPISQHQGLAFMLADMAREIEAARLLAWQAAYLLDQGENALDLALSAKAFAQDVAMRVTTDAVQVYGGYGYTKEYPVEKLMRDAKQYQIAEQTSLQSKVALARNLVMSGR